MTQAVEIPIIRLDDPDEAATVRRLRSCCLEHGFFYLGGHGMDDLFPDILAESARLFALPVEEKMLVRDQKRSRGYTGMEEKVLDPEASSKVGRGDTHEGFFVGRHVPLDHPEFDPAKRKSPNIWPTSENSSLQDCDRFRNVMEEYFDVATKVCLKVVQLLALAIGLEDKYALDEYFKEQFCTLRLLHYAAEQSNPESGLFACGKHTDWGMITLLLTDNNPGLQIQVDDKWIDVPPKSSKEEGSLFIVNLGDMLERWTNGMFRSTVHRVVTSGEKERYSVPFFCEPDFDTNVECLAVCCSEENPAKYPPTTSGQFLLDKYKETQSKTIPEPSM